MNNKSAFGTSVDSMRNTKTHTILLDERKDKNIEGVDHPSRMIDGIIEPHMDHTFRDDVEKYKKGHKSSF